ncbi:MAG TPA: PhzF family phenazine biosynthesis protein [Candidatus Acidoferrum sp.]|nr:PhzF family phenazine biosynthesis protein [Candidatus Acidoferrum sp.]
MAGTYRLRTVDVFTERSLAGNPLAIVLDAEQLSTERMQAIALEMNLSETTFILPPEHGGTARVRIFTPHAELPFAGHPTIGTAWVLLDEGRVVAPTDEMTLEEQIGQVPVRVERKRAPILLWMTHPPVQFGALVQERAAVAMALGLSEGNLAPDVPMQIASTGVPFVYVALIDNAAVDAATPSEEQLTRVLAPYNLPPVFLFARQDQRRLYSRMLGPHSITRILEDPATGSASGPLGAFAVRYGLIDRAADVQMVSEQGTKMGRQSFVHIKLAYRGSEDLPSKIEVGGSVVPALTGTLSLGS